RGEAHHDRRPRAGRAGADRGHRPLQVAGADGDLDLADGRAGHGEHQRRRVAEVLLEVDGAGPLRPDDGLELEIDVVERLGAGGVGGVVAERDVDDRDAGARGRLDLVHLDVRRDRPLDLAGDELLDLFRRGARPGRDGDGRADRDQRVLALGHAEVPDDAERRHHDQQNPADLPVLHEVAGRVVRAGDDVFVAAMGHVCLHGYGTTRTACPSATSEAPWTTTRSPGRRSPSTRTSLPARRPSVTLRARATSAPPAPASTAYATKASSPGVFTMAGSGRGCADAGGAAGAGASGNATETTIPRRSGPSSARLASTSKTRVELSDFGDTLVTSAANVRPGMGSAVTRTELPSFRRSATSSGTPNLTFVRPAAATTKPGLPTLTRLPTSMSRRTTMPSTGARSEQSSRLICAWRSRAE